MNTSAAPVESGWSRAAPTFARGLRAITQLASLLVRRHPRWLIAFAVITLGCGGLWLADYYSSERQALRRISQLRGWTAGPTVANQLFRSKQSNSITRALARFPSKRVVTGLVLEGKQPTDDDLAMFVAAFPRIEQLDVSSSPVTDESLEHIGRLPMLWYLKARHTDVTDAGVKHLTNCSQLQFVELDGTQITDAAIADLAKLPRLCRLSVSGTAVTDAGLAHLQGNLFLSLDVSGTRITDAGIAAFQAANPRCDVNR